MPRLPRLSVLGPGLMICLGQLGCAQTPEVPGRSSPVITPALDPAAETVIANPVPAESYSIPASSPASHTAYVEVKDTTLTTATDGFAHGYSNTYIYEELAAYGIGLFGSADYYDWGGYPVYYPYPYTIGFSSYYNPRIGTYGCASRTYGPYGGQGPVSPAVGQLKPGDGYAAQNSTVYRRTENGWQKRSGNSTSSFDSGRTSSGYSATQNRSSYGSRTAYNGTYTQNGHRNLNRGYGARRAGTSRSHQVSRRQMGGRMMVRQR